MRNQKEIKEEELRVHLETKPREVKDPSVLIQEAETQEKKEKLQRLETELLELNQNHFDLTESASLTSNHIYELTGFKNRLSQKISEIKEMIDFGKLNYESLGLNFNELVSAEFNDHVIDNLITNIVNTQKSNTEQLTIQDDFKTINIDELTLSSKIERCKFEISKIQDLFTGEQREYQQYLVALARWESGKKSIVGESTQSGTLSYINEMIRYKY